MVIDVNKFLNKTEEKERLPKEEGTEEEERLPEEEIEEEERLPEEEEIEEEERLPEEEIEKEERLPEEDIEIKAEENFYKKIIEENNGEKKLETTTIEQENNDVINNDTENKTLINTDIIGENKEEKLELNTIEKREEELIEENLNDSIELLRDIEEDMEVLYGAAIKEEYKPNIDHSIGTLSYKINDDGIAKDYQITLDGIRELLNDEAKAKKNSINKSIADIRDALNKQQEIFTEENQKQIETLTLEELKKTGTLYNEIMNVIDKVVESKDFIKTRSLLLYDEGDWVHIKNIIKEYVVREHYDYGPLYELMTLEAENGDTVTNIDISDGEITYTTEKQRTRKSWNEEKGIGKLTATEVTKLVSKFTRGKVTLSNSDKILNMDLDVLGYRVAIRHKDTVSGTTHAVSIRRRKKIPAIEMFYESKTIDNNLEVIFKWMMEKKKNLWITGGTGSGKTTYMRMIKKYYLDPLKRRIIISEDTPEIDVDSRYNVAFYSDEATIDNPITEADNIQIALRFQPDGIIVGEIRKPQTAEQAIIAANTGHQVLATFHANGIVEAVGRIADLLRQVYGSTITNNALMTKVKDSVDYILHLEVIDDPDNEGKSKFIIKEFGKIDPINPYVLMTEQLEKLEEMNDEAFKNPSIKTQQLTGNIRNKMEMMSFNINYAPIKVHYIKKYDEDTNTYTIDRTAEIAEKIKNNKLEKIWK